MLCHLSMCSILSLCFATFACALPRDYALPPLHVLYHETMLCHHCMCSILSLCSATTVLGTLNTICQLVDCSRSCWPKQPVHRLNKSGLGFHPSLPLDTLKQHLWKEQNTQQEPGQWLIKSRPFPLYTGCHIDVLQPLGQYCTPRNGIEPKTTCFHGSKRSQLI